MGKIDPVTRRQLIQTLGALGLASAVRVSTGCRPSQEGPRPPVAHQPVTRPRHLVTFFIRGGIDAILTTSPRKQSEVDDKVDVPYPASEMFTVAGRQFGPHLRGLERHLGDVAIVNGVYGASVQHDYAGTQLLRLKTRVTYEVPTIGEVIGGQLAQHPVTAIALGRVDIPAEHPPGLLSCVAGGYHQRATGHDLCDDITDLSPDQLALAADGLEQLAASPQADPGTTRSSRSIAQLMRRLAAGVPGPRMEAWIPELPPEERNAFEYPENGSVQRDCQRALWMLENELATSLTIQPDRIDWDSHTENFKWQTRMSGAFFPVLARFLDELKLRRNSHGTLASQTLVIVTSELGRLPRLNGQQGKDHLPEFPMMFFGPGIRTRDPDGGPLVAGHLGRRMEATPIDRITGRPSATGAVPSLDDIGATVLAAFGIAPRNFGYTGQPLDFLLEA
jgi:hypothetical protein